jgi:hypothetical protein
MTGHLSSILLSGGTEVPKQEVHWSLSLDVECPSCEHYFDFTSTDDWFEQFVGIQVCEANPGVKATCPECGVDFQFDVLSGQ